MEIPKGTLWKDIEIGFVRKCDGEIVNVKLFDVAKRFCTADFINNEIIINGETLIADSFCEPYIETRLAVKINSIEGGDGAYKINNQRYDTDQSFIFPLGTEVQITIIPNEHSSIKIVRDENNRELRVVEFVVTITMETSHVVSIDFAGSKDENL